MITVLLLCPPLFFLDAYLSAGNKWEQFIFIFVSFDSKVVTPW